MNGSANRRKGYTLPEMLVGAFLVGVVFFLLAQLLVPSLLLFRLQTARSDVHQGAIVATHWVQRHLSNTRLETVTILPYPSSTAPTIPTPAAISFREVNEDDPFDSSTGIAKMAEKFRIMYFDDVERVVVTKEWPPDPPNLSFDFALTSTQPSLPPEDLSDICRQSNGTERVLAKNVESLVISDEDGDVATLSPPLAVTVNCAEEARDRRQADDEKAIERFSMTARVVPRNVRW